MFHLCNVVLLLLDCFYFYFVARMMARYLSNVPWLKMNCGFGEPAVAVLPLPSNLPD